MAYRSLGLDCSQEQVWRRICGRAPRGGARANALAADALEQDLAAVVVQTHDPWRFLQACALADARVILNHRIARHSPWGHFTLLDEIDERTAWVHDPQFGPRRRLAKEELLGLWQGYPGRTEIAGQVAIVIDRPDDQQSNCPTCQRALPSTLPCPNCRHAVLLRPVVALGCLDPQCARRSWRQVFCARCDWALVVADQY
jgi:hypothetical protein